MRRYWILLAAPAAFGLAPLASRLGQVGAAVGLVSLGVALACAASESCCALAVACGAAAALGGAIGGTVSPACGGALLVTLAYAERWGRVRARASKIAHVTATAVAGAAAAALASTHAGATFGLQLVAVVVGAVFVALPMLIEAEDPIAHAIDGAASATSEPVQGILRQCAELRRDEVDGHANMAAGRSSWSALVALAIARARAERLGSRAPAPQSAAGGADAYRSAPSTLANLTRARLDTSIEALFADLTRAHQGAVATGGVANETSERLKPTSDGKLDALV